MLQQVALILEDNLQQISQLPNEFGTPSGFKRGQI
jgi:hypothetical protein